MRSKYFCQAFRMFVHSKQPIPPIHPPTHQRQHQYICPHRALAPDFTAFSAASRVLLVQLSFCTFALLDFYTFVLFGVVFSGLPVSRWLNLDLPRNSVIIAPVTLKPTSMKNISNQSLKKRQKSGQRLTLSSRIILASLPKNHTWGHLCSEHNHPSHSNLKVIRNFFF